MIITFILGRVIFIRKPMRPRGQSLEQLLVHKVHRVLLVLLEQSVPRARKVHKVPPVLKVRKVTPEHKVQLVLKEIRAIQVLKVQPELRVLSVRVELRVYRVQDRKSTRLNSSHVRTARMPCSA